MSRAMMLGNTLMAAEIARVDACCSVWQNAKISYQLKSDSCL
jgi:hypothetical protein